nr:NmrA family NAD(P)-binding protein [Tranquillimonas alkanivorans]
MAIKNPFLITGASGKSGREVRRALYSAGAPSRAGVREPRRPGEVRLDFRNPRTWEPALDGAQGVFLLRPPAIADIDETLGPFIDMARRLGIGHIVFLSVAGAERNPLLPHAAVERRLRARPGDWTILRPGFFAQNLEDAYLRDIREENRLYVPAGHGRVAFLDLRDLGAAAALCLSHPEAHLGRSYTLTGPDAVTFDAVAAALSRATGRKIVYERASVPGYVRHLRARGAPAGLVTVQTLLHVGLSFGQAAEVAPDLERMLGHPSRSIFDYIRDNVQLWAAAAEGKG